MSSKRSLGRCRSPPALRPLLIVAQGSYGSVFLGRQLKNSEMVAVKVISIDDPQTLEDVRREIRILSECNHPNIVKYYGSYFKDQNLWVRLCIFPPMPIFAQIAMEYCAGGSVCDIMAILDAPLREEQIAFICREALKGLQYASPTALLSDALNVPQIPALNAQDTQRHKGR